MYFPIATASVGVGCADVEEDEEGNVLSKSPRIMDSL